MEEVGVSYERFAGNFERIVKRLDDVGKVRPKRKLGDGMGQVHLIMLDVRAAGISMTEGGDM